ncbi:MAG: lysophospholipid acyltransferase family protein [Myxococcota bacterium]|nr:lysophospholipid acyltransferase family protein [Myxococcota bacterium]
MNSKLPDSSTQNKLFYGLPFHHWLSYRITWLLLWVIGIVLFRHRNNKEIFKEIPKDESYFLLSNHASFLDPFWVAHPPFRPVRFMTSAHVMKLPILGRYLRSLGSFAKQKFTKDRQAMKQLQTFYEQGFPITIFPEGRRTWNGRLEPILPGIGRLIKRTNAKVVFARMNTAYLFQPRWAKYPRWVPIETVYDGPHQYPMHWTAEQITDDVQQKLQVNAEIKTNAWTFGWRMAHGLPEYLWACPACFSIESLKVSNGNYIQCQDCHANWKIDIHTHLNGHTDTTVADAFDKIVAHFQFPPIVNHEQFNHEEIALESSEVCVIMKLNTGFHTIGQGLLQVTKDGLTLSHPTGTWHAKYEDIGAISVELANRLFINVSGIPHEIVPKGSRYMWAYFIRQWKAFTLGSEL